MARTQIKNIGQTALALPAPYNGTTMVPNQSHVVAETADEVLRCFRRSGAALGGLLVVTLSDAAATVTLSPTSVEWWRAIPA